MKKIFSSDHYNRLAIRYVSCILILFSPKAVIFTHLKLCLATATNNLKWVKTTHICLLDLQIVMLKNSFHSQ